MNLISRQSNTVVGLTLEGGMLHAVEVKRSNGSVQILKEIAAPLTLDPLRDDAELVGREIRNALNSANISTRRCVAGAPAGWALAMHTQLPPVEGEDLASLLEIEAERGFACNVDELQLSHHVYEAPNGEKHATIIGIPRDYLERFEAVLIAAQLKLASLSLGLLALPSAPSHGITAEIADSRVNLLVTSSAGILALRTIEGVFEAEGAEKRVQGEVLARELRITLGQLAPNLREEIREMHILGEQRFADQLASDLLARRTLNLRTRRLTNYPEKHFGVSAPANATVSGALSLAIAFLSDQKPGFEFLLPKPSVWEQMAAKYSSRRLAYVGGAAGILLLAALGAFALQAHQLSNLRSEWNGMRDKVEELEKLQGKIRQFRPWHDNSLRAMNIMRRVTEAFPETGSVSAKIIEIRDGTLISCSGTAQDSQSVLATIDRLRAQPNISQVGLDQMRGRAPVQFTFQFTWGGAANEN